MRLTKAGTQRVTRWFDGAEVEQSDLHLARRLAMNGMAHVGLMTNVTENAPYVVIVPVYNDHAGLRATLDGLAEPFGLVSPRVIVVDDGSDEPVDVAERGREIEVLRIDGPTGPASARNAGLRHIHDSHDGPVAFVDAGVRISASTLDVLVRQLQEPVVAPVLAVAPRVRSTPGPGLIASYDCNHSPLDLGPVGGYVGPGRPLSYVPTACLVMSAAGIAASQRNDADTFDPQLRFGEDVDLIWRIAKHGAIRYIPGLEAHHPPRTTIGAFVKQRINYGSAAAPLGKRHGSYITPFRTSWWGLGVTLSLFGGHPFIAAVVGIVSAVSVRRQLPDDLEDRSQHALRLVGEGHVHSLTAFAAAAVRPWWPLTIALGLRQPHAALRLLGVAALRRLVGSRHESALAPRPTHVGLGLVDDVAYGVGVLKGCVESSTLRPLLPTVTS